MCREHGHVARDALRVRLCVHSGASRAWCLQAERLIQAKAKAEARPVGCARSRPCTHARYVGCGRSTHRAHACIGRIPLRFDCRAFAAIAKGAWKNRPFPGLWRTRAASRVLHGACHASHAARCMLPVVWWYVERNPVAPPVVEYRRLASLSTHTRTPSPALGSLRRRGLPPPSRPPSLRVCAARCVRASAPLRPPRTAGRGRLPSSARLGSPLPHRR